MVVQCRCHLRKRVMYRFNCIAFICSCLSGWPLSVSLCVLAPSWQKWFEFSTSSTTPQYGKNMYVPLKCYPNLASQPQLLLEPTFLVTFSFSFHFSISLLTSNWDKMFKAYRTKFTSLTILSKDQDLAKCADSRNTFLDTCQLFAMWQLQGRFHITRSMATHF